MSGYKYLILTDLDGTLLRSDDTLSQDTLDYVHKLNQRDDVLFSFSTGRSWKEAKWVYEALQIKGFVSCCNGSVIYDPHTNSTVYSYLSEKVWKETLLNDDFFKNIKGGSILTDKEEAIKFDEDVNRPELVKRIIDSRAKVYKIKLFFRQTDPAEDDKDVDNRLVFLKSFDVPPALTIYRYSIHNAIDFELQSPIASKEKAVEFFSNYYGIKRHNIITFGDQVNDLPVALGSSSFTAVMNAVDLLKYSPGKLSKFTNNEDAVIKEIDIFLKKEGVI